MHRQTLVDNYLQGNNNVDAVRSLRNFISPKNST
jgi:hypothetical protein